MIVGLLLGFAFSMVEQRFELDGFFFDKYLCAGFE
jgi:hypothetical protein